MAPRSVAPTACLIALGALLCAQAAHAIDLNALRTWDIVVTAAKDAPAERYAAEEFQRLYALAAGRQIPIRNAPGAATGHVFIGRTLPEGAGRPAGEPLGPEDLRIVIGKSNIAIVGGGPRGVLYGVYTFAEDYLGVRFLTADHTHVPPLAKDAQAGPLDRTYRPPLTLRWSYYGEMGADKAFATRLRANTLTTEPRLGGRTPMRLINHSFHRWLSWKMYGETHPEYYNEIDGKRPKDIENEHYFPGIQPCLTNPDVLRIVTEGVLEDLAKHPEWTNISVSQYDNESYCRCAKCAEIDEREGSPMGSLLTFVNAVADAVAEKHPDVMVGTLAYKYTRKPPRTLRPRPNVQIQLCNIECCMNHGIDDPDCPLNAPFCEEMAAWGRICDTIYIWHYNTNFASYLLPCPNLRTIEPSVRYFTDNGARGIMFQGAYHIQGGEFSELRNYVTSRLLWDPSLDGGKLVNEFLDLHYAEAAEPIRQFLDFSHAKAAASGRHQRCSRPGAHYGLDREVGEVGLKRFAEAMKLAKTDEIRSRVEKVSICAHAMMVDALFDVDTRMNVYYRMLRGEPLMDPVDPARLAEARPHLRRIFELSKKHGIKKPAEWVFLPKAIEAFRKLYGLAEDEEF